MSDVLWTVHVDVLWTVHVDVLWTVHFGCIVDCAFWIYCGLYMLDVLWTVHVVCALNAHKLYVHTCTLYPLYVVYLVSIVCIVSSCGPGLGDISLPSLTFMQHLVNGTHTPHVNQIESPLYLTFFLSGVYVQL